MVQFSRLLGISPVDSYNLGYPVLIVPWMTFGFLTFVETLGGPNVPLDWKSWLVICLSFIGVLPIEANSKTTSFSFKLISESYVCSVTLGFFFVSAFIEGLRSGF